MSTIHYKDWNYHQFPFRLPPHQRKILEALPHGSIVYCGCGYNYPNPDEFVPVYVRNKDGGYIRTVAAYSTFQPLAEIAATREQRLDLLRSLRWFNALGVELKGVCAWMVLPIIHPGTMHKLGEYHDCDEQTEG